MAMGLSEESSRVGIVLVDSEFQIPDQLLETL